MARIDENTVDVKHQVKDTESVIFDGAEKSGPRIMFVGNSITYHAPAPELDWHGSWGMSASAPEKDYVHCCMSEIRKLAPDAAFCVCKAGRWELNYPNSKQQLYRFEAARAFEADIIVMRAVENCPKGTYEKAEFMEQYSAFVEYLNPTGKAAVILTTGFWKHPADEAIQAVAGEKGYPLCHLNDLGEHPEMKAYGLFEHKGVAAHPGDLGMKTIANRICAILCPILKERFL